MNLEEMDNEGLRLMKSERYREAIDIYQKIITENPEYEWGACFFYIADCYRYLGEFIKAKEYYLKSIQYDDTDEIRVGNYASFLYLHGDDPKEAFKWCLYLLYLQKRTNNERKRTLEGLDDLAKKIGLSNEEVQKLIDDKDAAELFIKTA